jgi:hypothetical protein
LLIRVNENPSQFKAPFSPKKVSNSMDSNEDNLNESIAGNTNVDPSLLDFIKTGKYLSAALSLPK